MYNILLLLVKIGNKGVSLPYSYISLGFMDDYSFQLIYGHPLSMFMSLSLLLLGI